MSWADFLKPALSIAAAAAPAIIASTAGTATKNDAASAGAAQTTAGLQKGADLLSTAYDQAHDVQTGAIGNVAADQAKNFQTITPLISAIPGAYEGALKEAAGELGPGLVSDVDATAAKYYSPTAAGYTGTLGTGADQFGTTLGKNARGYAGNLTDIAKGIFAPYTGAGGQALSVLQGISATNPSQLTPAQQLAMDKYMRTAQGSLAASGLRGSGRAATAALDDGLANLTAQDTAQNQARIDNATGQLLSAGELGSNQEFGAGSAGEGAKLNAGTAGAQSVLNAINTGAANENALGIREGDQALAGSEAGTNAGYSAGVAGANAGKGAADNLINATTNYLAQKAGTDFAQGQADTSQIMGKGSAEAGAAQGIGAVNGAVTAANGANWGGAMGTLGGIISSDLKSNLLNTPSSYASTSVAPQSTSSLSSSYPLPTLGDTSSYGAGFKEGGKIGDKVKRRSNLHMIVPRMAA